MQEKFDLALPGDFTIPRDNSRVQKNMNAIFSQGGEPYMTLVAALTEENKEKFGSPKFTGLHFEVKQFNPSLLSGRLRIKYNMELTFSCSGIINYLNNQHSYWNFKIDKALAVVRFVGDEYGDLRSTADEF
ncbi:hypothetical protein EWM62_13615 [Mucilaginibacter terrigena]|uniref:Uncharacterized protein n=1 Tax=Mucilaginibacter terrigena TaxID=2492395 RepID=A0A4Q5LL31_9SPHI|nr:hypothetical protein [Mucilaginibacter terrigena]RYU89362.1 hypothetical protein EWM62_13615 [Mucilaginibacter terrigena]